MQLSQEEIYYLRDLGKKVSEIAQHPEWVAKTTLWQKKNALQKVRPLVLSMLPEVAWQELIPTSQQKITNPLFREIEWKLLKRIYRYERIKDDNIIDNKLYIPIKYSFSDWYDNRKRPYSGDGKSAEKFYPCIIDYSDIKKLKKPKLQELDIENTRREIEYVKEVFFDLLEVIEGEPFNSDTDNNATGWGLSAVDILCELRGLENVLYDMVDNPDFIHEAMTLICEGLNEYLDQMVQNGLLCLNNNSFSKNSNTPLGSNGLACLEDPISPIEADGAVKPKNLWGYFMSQEFAMVSPDMTNEFVYQYQKKLSSRFGLTCYGCCEPNDMKWDLIQLIFDNLRAVSVSHASNLEIAAEKIKDKYVFSWKPHCMLIEPYNEDHIRNVFKNAFEMTKNCHLVCSMRDNLTLYGHPERAEKWVKLAMEAAIELN